MKIKNIFPTSTFVGLTSKTFLGMLKENETLAKTTLIAVGDTDMTKS